MVSQIFLGLLAVAASVHAQSASSLTTSITTSSTASTTSAPARSSDGLDSLLAATTFTSSATEDLRAIVASIQSSVSAKGSSTSAASTTSSSSASVGTLSAAGRPSGGIFTNSSVAASTLRTSMSLSTGSAPVPLATGGSLSSTATGIFTNSTTSTMKNTTMTSMTATGTGGLVSSTATGIFTNGTISSMNATSTAKNTTTSATTSADGGTTEPTHKINAEGFGDVTPCKAGGGTRHGCGDCFPDKALSPKPLAGANLTEFDNSNFVSKDGGGGGSVWFSVPQPKAGCKVLFFAATPGMAPPMHVPGIMTAIADNAGCFFVNTGNLISVNYCCGNDECQSIGAGLMTQAPTKQRRTAAEYRDEIAGNVKPAPEKAAPVVARIAPPAVEAAGVIETRDDPVYSFYGAADTFSANNIWTPPPAGPNEWCEAAVKDPQGQEFARAGQQQLVGNREKCTGSFCSFGVSASMASGTTLDVTNSNEKSDSHGQNWSGTVGYQGDFGPTALFTAGGDKSWTNAITNSTATSNSSTATTEISDSLGVQYGTWAQLALVPQLTCTPYIARCHNGSKIENMTIEKCTPLMNSTDPKSAAYVAFPVNFGTY